MSRPQARGTGLLELLVGTLLGLVVLGMLTTTVGTGARLLATAAARGELEDIAELAVEALAFDVRRAGYDPLRIGVAALAEAHTDRVGVRADLDGDGVVDDTSEEAVAYVCNPSARRLSRIVGRQSLPLANGATTCAFRYFDATGAALAVPVAGLAPAERARVRSVALDLTLAAAGLHVPATRTVRVALRVPG